MNKIEALEQALAAATPGEWPIESEEGRSFITGEGRQLTKILVTHANIKEDSARVARAKANAHLITLMKNSLPDLLEAVRALEILQQKVFSDPSHEESIPFHYRTGMEIASNILAKLKGEVP